MASSQYDEDVYENTFFMGIITTYPNVLEKMVSYKGLLCVPKFSMAMEFPLTKADAMDHVLLPLNVEGDGSDDQDKEDYVSASGKNAVLRGGKVITGKGFKIQGEVTILFSETFHTDTGGCYKVLCIDGFLNKHNESSKASQSIPTSAPTSYQQCMDLLWSHPGGHKTKETLDKVLHTYSMVYERLEGDSLRTIMDAANTHFARAMQLVLKDSVVRKTVRHNVVYMDSLKLAVETYVMNAIYKRLFRVVTAAMSSKDAEINKITRNLVELQLSDLGVRKMFNQNIPAAKKELSMLNHYSTPMGRLFCVKRTVVVLTKPPRKMSNASMSDKDNPMMTSDDLLPILIFLIIKSEVPNWYANLVYMRHFHFAKASEDDEFSFYLATIEAALEHILSGNIQDEIQPLSGKIWNSFSLCESDELLLSTSPRSASTQTPVIQEFFKHVQEGNEKAVQAMLEKPSKTTEEINLMLCHPLCSCDRCDKMLSVIRTNSDLVTAYTRDNRGYTALHIAAYYGQGLLIDVLVKNKAAVDATDYLGMTPLHLACQRGYQNVMLLLLHFSADAVALDNEGNTPLHFSCVNGHEDCVKALLFYDGSIKKLQVNATNEMRDTPLHLAAKWGFEGIVKALLENGANALICNRKNQTAMLLAQNVRVQRLLQMAADGLFQDTSCLMLHAPSTLNRESSGEGTPSSPAHSLTSSTRSVHSPTSSLLDSSTHNTIGATTSSYSPSTSCRIETASLDTDNATEKRKRTEKLFRAIIEGDIQLVKFYLGIADQPAVPEELYGDAMDQVDTDAVPVVRGDHGNDDNDTQACHPLCQCQKCVTIQRTNQVLGEKVGVNIRTPTGSTPLHTAILHNHSDIVELLISLHADAGAQNHKFLTPLHLACCMRNSLVTDLLVKAKVDLDVHDMNGDTPLLIAASNGFINGVYTLIKAGASINAVNRAGNTALHEAARRHLTDTMGLLARHGLDTSLTNKDGKLATDYCPNSGIIIVQEIETQPSVVIDTKDATETNTQTAIEAEMQPATEIDTKDATETDSQTAADTITQPTPETKTQTTPEAETQPTTEINSKDATETKTTISTD